MSIHNEEKDGILIVDDWNNVSVFNFPKKKKYYRRQIRFVLMVLAATLGSFLAAGCARYAEPVTFPHARFDAGFILPTGKKIPFSEVYWCHGIICREGTDCAIYEMPASCAMRTMRTEQIAQVLTEELTLYMNPHLFYLIAPRSEADRFLGLLYEENGAWLAVRFPGERPLPTHAERLHIAGKPVIYLSFEQGESISYSQADRIFRAEHIKRGRVRDTAADL